MTRKKLYWDFAHRDLDINWMRNALKLNTDRLVVLEVEPGTVRSRNGGNFRHHDAVAGKILKVKDREIVFRLKGGRKDYLIPFGKILGVSSERSG